MIKLHNTLTRQTETFQPQKAGHVSLYTCGPTVYDYLHVGNWSAYIYWDTLVRLLSATNFEVERVMNITDVGHLVSDADEGEDKLEKGARREGKTAWDVAKFYTEDFLNGMQKLNLVSPTHITKATDYIEPQLELIRTLRAKGFTYQINDGIYFDTAKFPTYPDFAKLNLDAIKAGARVDYNAEKRNPSDFALWKFSPAGSKRDMEWETPPDLLDNSDQTATGFGFPGWHLECSAMAMDILGPTLDIHTGGIDHIPVHHTNEIAQSEASTDQRFANFWLHNNHLKSDGTKISKSLGNGYTLQDLTNQGYSPLDYRMLVLQSHYRSESNFSFENLAAARSRRLNWRNITALRHQLHQTLQPEHSKSSDNRSRPLLALNQALLEAIANDLGTPQALQLVDEAFSELATMNRRWINRQTLISLLETIDQLLGLDLIGTTPDLTDEQKQRLLERERAREQKDWATSDQIRDEFEEQGITLNDSNSETVWQYKS